MKKIFVSMALLGFVSVCSMAFIHHDNDEPPTRRTEVNCQRHGHYGHHDDRRGYRGNGGCCNRDRNCDYRRNDDCCGYKYDCGACQDRRCTVRDYHNSGNLCSQCAEWAKKRSNDDVYRND